MKPIRRADRVIVVLSDKYLRSPYCMTELHTIYRRSNEEKGTSCAVLSRYYWTMRESANGTIGSPTLWIR
jgi:hypothetical protein